MHTVSNKIRRATVIGAAFLFVLALLFVVPSISANAEEATNTKSEQVITKQVENEHQSDASPENENVSENSKDEVIEHQDDAQDDAATVTDEQNQEASGDDEAQKQKENLQLEANKEEISLLADPVEIATGTCGTVYWALFDNGHLHLTAGTLDDNLNGWCWDYLNKITNVYFVSGVVKAGKSVNSMFCGEQTASSMTTIEPISGVTGYFDFSNAKETKYTFLNCSKLKTIDTSHFNLSNTTSTEAMFRGCSSLSLLSTTNWNLSNTTDTSDMFYGCLALKTLDTTNWNLRSCINAHGMFAYCKALTSLNVTNWNVANIKHFSWMFLYCENLKSLDLSKWTTTSATDFAGFLTGAEKITYLDVSNFKTGNVYDTDSLSIKSQRDRDSFRSMFQGMSSLKSIKGIENWDVRKAGCFSAMFDGCESLTSLNLSNWKLGANGQKLYLCAMFKNCYSLKELNMSNFNTQNAQITIPSDYDLPHPGMTRMFYGDTNLRKITFSNNWKVATVHNEIFPTPTKTINDTTSNGFWGKDKASTTSKIYAGDSKKTMDGNWGDSFSGQILSGTWYAQEWTTDSQSLSLTKTVNGQAPLAADGTFTFELYEGSTKVASATTDSQGKATMSLRFSQTGANSYTHNYTVKEVSKGIKGWTYAKDQSIVSNTTRAGSVYSTKLSKPSLSFNNAYQPTATSTNISLTKTVNGQAPLAADGTFTFELYEGSTKVASATTDSQGKATLNIKYTSAGTHNYTVKEVSKGIKGWTYAKDQTITSTVTDDRKGNLSVKNTKSELTFDNQYHATNTEKVTLSVITTVDKKTDHSYSFSYNLKEPSGNLIESLTTEGGTAKTFSSLAFTEPGVYKYTIACTEEAQTIGDYWDLAEAVDATVTVTDDRKGTITASVEYSRPYEDKAQAWFNHVRKYAKLKIFTYTEDASKNETPLANATYAFSLASGDNWGNRADKETRTSESTGFCEFINSHINPAESNLIWITETIAPDGYYKIQPYFIEGSDLDNVSIYSSTTNAANEVIKDKKIGTLAIDSEGYIILKIKNLKTPDMPITGIEQNYHLSIAWSVLFAGIGLTLLGSRKAFRNRIN